MDSALPTPTSALVAATATATEDADFRAVVSKQSPTIVFPSHRSGAEIIDHLAKQVPANEYGLPIFYYRSDLLPLNEAMALGYLSQDDVDIAASPLFYHDGYPTLESGSPFWTRLVHEPTPAYLLFQRFLEMAEEEGIRLLDSLATEQNTPLPQLRQYFQEFYWSARTRAYDLFIVAADQKRREARIRRTENRHFLKAQDLLDKILLRFNNEPGLFDSMEPKELLEAFEMMVKIQRLSLGLTGAQASTNQNLPAQGSTVEVILRSLTQQVGLSPTGQESFSNRLTALLSDPTTAMQAQELIIKAHGGGHI